MKKQRDSYKYRPKMFKAKPPICKCGGWKHMQVHHKDFNHKNNDLDNLEWLCEDCHLEVHGRRRVKKSFHQLNKKYKKGTSKRKRK